jgi:hypothetical protein
LGVGEGERRAGCFVLLQQTRTEQERVVGVEGAPDACFQELRQGVRRQGCDDPEGDVGGGADVEDYAFRGQAGKKSRVFDCPYAVSDPSCAEYVECGAHAGRSGKFPCMRGGNQPGIAGNGERFGERLRGVAGFISGQAEGDHPII